MEKNEESHDSFAAFNQPSSACSYTRKGLCEATMRRSRGMKRLSDTVAMLSESCLTFMHTPASYMYMYIVT